MKKLKAIVSVMIMISLSFGIAPVIYAMDGGPEISIAEVAVGGGGYKLVFAASASSEIGSISVFNVAMSYDNNIIVPVNANTGAEIANITSSTMGQKSAPFKKHEDMTVLNLAMTDNKSFTTFNITESIGGEDLGVNCESGVVLLEFYFKIKEGKTTADINSNTFTLAKVSGNPSFSINLGSKTGTVYLYGTSNNSDRLVLTSFTYTNSHNRLGADNNLSDYPIVSVIPDKAESDGTIINFSNPFIDVHQNDWFYESVKYAYQKSLINGTSVTTFSPKNEVTRGMMVTILWNHSGKQTSSDAGFTDIPENAWYTVAVNWAAAKEIIAGVGNNRFAPSDKITREQMAVMLHNYAKFIGAELPKKRTGVFDDEAQISAWAKEAVTTMYTAEILNGKGQNIFDPQGKATRAEAAAIFYNFLTAI